MKFGKVIEFSPNSDMSNRTIWRKRRTNSDGGAFVTGRESWVFKQGSDMCKICKITRILYELRARWLDGMAIIFSVSGWSLQPIDSALNFGFSELHS